MFTPEQQAQYEAWLPEETNREEEVVLYYRVVATNTGQVPRYAWFQAPLIQWFQGGFAAAPRHSGPCPTAESSASRS